MRNLYLNVEERDSLCSCLPMNFLLDSLPFIEEIHVKTSLWDRRTSECWKVNAF